MMQPRLILSVWVSLGMALTGWQEVEGVPQSPSPECTTTVIKVPILCQVVVHHKGNLPELRKEKEEQLKRQICPCPHFRVGGLLCLEIVHILARKYAPAKVCGMYRDPVLQTSNTSVVTGPIE